MLTLREKAIGAAAIVLLALCCMAGYQWLQEHDARLQAQSESALQKRVSAEAQAAIQAAQESKRQNDADLKTALAAIAAQRTVVVTPQQAAAVANQLPGLPVPVRVQAVEASASAPATEEIVIPKADIPAFQKYKLDCDEKSARLNVCQLNAAADKLIGDQRGVQLAAMTKDRDNWKAAANGGTWKRRLAKSLKCIGFSAGGAYLGAKVKDGTGAAVGAIAGQVGCSLF